MASVGVLIEFLRDLGANNRLAQVQQWLADLLRD